MAATIALRSSVEAPETQQGRSTLANAPRKDPAEGGQSAHETARRLIKERRLRDRFFPADLSDAGWNMLLDLFTASGVGQSVSVSSVCLASGAPLTTALRYTDKMTKDGTLVRTSDPGDRRRFFLSLAPATHTLMTLYLETLATCGPR
jgi:DNA-binding MarR family transcriptional regulator